VPFDPEAVRLLRSEGTEFDYANTIDVDAFPDVDELITRIDRWRDPLARLRALILVVGYLAVGATGSSPSSARLCAEFRALADDMGLISARALARIYRAALLGTGNLDAALAQLDEADAMTDGRATTGSVGTMVRELTVQQVAPDWPRAAEMTWQLATRAGESEWLNVGFAAFAAQAFAYAGEEEQAREILGYVIAAEIRGSVQSLAVGLTAGAIWELYAGDLAAMALPRALALATSGVPDFYMNSTELSVARLMTVLDRFDEAVEYFDRARVTLEGRGQWVMRAIVDYDEALARLAHKQPGATALLAAASAEFDQLGMHDWSRRAAQVKVADPELPDGLTAREAQILRLVAVRRTNREIAAELFLSVHTVERHVQNAYRKISVCSRAEAGDYVARVGL
jgi:DNA-binding CsgD family transcriptional regulator